MSGFGQITFEKIGNAITVSADGSPELKTGGACIAWSEIEAHTADTIYSDYDYVYAGEKYIRYGTVLCQILTATDTSLIGKFVPYGTAAPAGGSISSGARGEWYILNRSVHENDPKSDYAEVLDSGKVYSKRLDVEDLGGFGNEVQTVTLGAGNTGGTFALTFSGQTASGIAYNALGSDVQTALEGLSNIAPGDVTVTGGAGGPYTVTFSGVYADTNVPVMTGTGSLTGGANTVTIATTVTTGPALATFLSVFPLIKFA